VRRGGAAPGKVAARITSDQLQLQDTRPSSGLARAGSTRDTAYERVKSALEEQGRWVRDHGSVLQSECPSHEDSEPSLTIYAKPQRIRIRCWAGCDDVDVLAALGLGVRDVFDSPRATTGRSVIDPRIQARIERRRGMTPVQRATDDLLQLPDLAERLVHSIARIEKQQSGTDYWLRRADEWLAAQPRVGDFPGGLPSPPAGYDPTPNPRRDRPGPFPLWMPGDPAIVLVLRDELLQTIEVDGRTALINSPGGLNYLNKQVSNYARKSLDLEDEL
jgi:hypothetical protein